MIKVAAWKDLSLSNQATLESRVTNIFKQTKSSFMRINDNEKYDLSLLEQPLIKRGSEYMLPEVSDLQIGDELFNYDNPSEPIVIESLNEIEEERDVFLFYREPWGLVVAASMLAYNGCATNDKFVAENEYQESAEEVVSESQDN